MTINLSKILQTKRTEGKLSFESMAKAIGVSTVSVKGVIDGKSKPNATTAKKYAAYLGIDVAELISVNAAKKSSKGKGAKAKAPKAAKAAAQGKKSSTKVSAKSAGKTKVGLGAELSRAIGVAAAVLDDELALAVHTAGKLERDIIGRLLKIG